MSRPLCVGVTGGIGSGKSAVTERLGARGITIVDADVVAREVVAPGTEALAAIAAHFGEALLDEHGALDRRALREIVFDNPDERRWLEELTHPRIGAQINDKLAAATSVYAVLSSPLLLEGSQQEFVDHIVVVDVPEATQIARAMARDNNTEALIKAIMQAQLPREQRLAKAHTVIDNSGSLTDLDEQVTLLHEKLLAAAKAVAPKVAARLAEP